MNVNRSRVVVVAIALLALSPLALAADAPAAVGTWDVVATTPDGELPAVITIKMMEGQVKGEIEIAGMKQTVSDEKLEGNVLRMKVAYEGGTYDLEAKIDGNTIEGTWQGGGYSGTLKGTRRS